MIEMERWPASLQWLIDDADEVDLSRWRETQMESGHVHRRRSERIDGRSIQATLTNSQWEAVLALRGKSYRALVNGEEAIVALAPPHLRPNNLLQHQHSVTIGDPTKDFRTVTVEIVYRK
ncbi:MAG: hypothetical protein DI537_23740 [Stutzerimonas stutzeri]|nr:MAG: hypothetical protein DI537_23740 [Stutzerimonas stutzeri]